ncbi:hypothetical protein ACFOGJ_08440 [Marinibaculum pumilum]|uniref:O-GlcNAc transferase C-terminal domain-containing protein n=1 Tax=Marinibaculum pumilum TaxID=1766165 RepID=A0ABV7KY47_9PROT
MLDRLSDMGLTDEVLVPSSGIHKDGEIETAVVLYRSFLAQRSRRDGPRGNPTAVPTVLRNMSIALLQLGELEEARQFHIRALTAGFQDVSGISSWADYLMQQGYLEEARQEIETRLLTAPDSAPLRSLHFTLSEFGFVRPGSHLAEHMQWWAGQAPVPPMSGAPRPPEGRPLRLGVIVRDLRSHSSFNRTFDAFPHLQGDEFDISLISVRSGPALRGPLAALQVHDMEVDEPERFARDLADLGLDMLLDLVSHGNSKVFAALRHRPAPVQMGWISSGISAGVPWIDYMLTDGMISPVGSEHHYSETLVRLPAPAFAVPSLPEAPDLVEPPFFRNGHITFGVFNRVSKMTPESMDAWAEILRRVPTARLRIQNSNVILPGVTSRLTRFFAERGVAVDRLDFFGSVPEAAYLRDVGETDIALEPFPQTGGVTAFDAMWMGVPTVIRIVDDRPCCRAALLPATGAGIGALVARGQAEYVENAVMLADQPDLLRQLRFSMRQKLADAVFTRPEALAGSLRRALRAIWDQACTGQRAPIWID